MTTEVGSFVGELVRGSEKVDVEDVLDRLGDGCESDVTAIALTCDSLQPSSSCCDPGSFVERRCHVGHIGFVP